MDAAGDEQCRERGGGLGRELVVGADHEGEGLGRGRGRTGRRLGDEEQVGPEGCLSIPEQYAEVTRPKQVRLRWLGLDGKTHEEEFDGLWATCAQHELDHLDGRLFIDHIGPMKRQMIARRMTKMKREMARA